MSDLISREALKKEIFDVYEYEYPTASGEFDKFVTRIIPNIINNVPTVEVVRCKDCRHGKCVGIEFLCRAHSGSERKLGEDRHYSEWHDGNWFCADGERKEASE